MAIAPLFAFPSLSWVLTAEDTPKVADRLAAVGMDQHTFARNLGYASWDALWDDIANRPAGLGLGPHSWKSKTGALGPIIDPVQPWEAKIAAHQDWQQQLLDTDTTVLCATETSILSLIGPHLLNHQDRSFLLGLPYGFWFSTCDATGAITTPQFLDAAALDGLATVMHTVGLLTCWSHAEKRTLHKHLPGWDGHITALETTSNDTPWLQAMDSNTMRPTGGIASAFQTLACLARLRANQDADTQQRAAG